MRGAVEAAVALYRTKSAIAGKQSESVGQTTTTGGVPQSGPCVQPSKLIKPQEMVGGGGKECHRKEPLTGTPVSPRHDAPLCGPAPLPQPPLPQISIILRHGPLLAWPPMRQQLARCENTGKEEKRVCEREGKTQVRSRS